MIKNLSIINKGDDLSTNEAVQVCIDIEDGFTYGVDSIGFRTEKFYEFINEYNKSDTTFEFDYSSNKANIFKKIKSEKIRFYVSGNSQDLSVSFYTKSEEMSNSVWKLAQRYIQDDSGVLVYFNTFFMVNGQFQSKMKIFDINSMNSLSEMYYPYIDIGCFCDQFFTGAENILLIVGQPGLGKSKLSSLMLKYAYENTDKLPYNKLESNVNLDEQYISVAFVKSNEVLSCDKFWEELGGGTYDFVILDDLDYMLTRRDAEISSHDDQIKNKFLNQFLSFTDGIEKHSTKFIITTNQEYADIDDALLRKGRLFDILELRKLKNAEALRIWEENKLNVAEFNTLFDGDVLSANLGSEISKRLNKRIAEATKPYLLEDGISKIGKSTKHKKIGL